MPSGSIVWRMQSEIASPSALKAVVAAVDHRVVGEVVPDALAGRGLHEHRAEVHADVRVDVRWPGGG